MSKPTISAETLAIKIINSLMESNLSASSLPPEIWHEITESLKYPEYALPILACHYEHEADCAGSCNGTLVLYFSELFRKWFGGNRAITYTHKDKSCTLQIDWYIDSSYLVARYWQHTITLSLCTAGASTDAFFKPLRLRTFNYSSVNDGKFSCNAEVTQELQAAIVACATEIDKDVQALRKMDFVYPKPH